MAKLLLVDDRPQNLIALQAILEPLEHELVTADSGTEALRTLLAQDDFAVILLDVQMPGMDGFEVASVIKERDRTSAIPIIFLTALSKDERNVFRGYEIGAVDYVFKPFQPEILRAKVGVFVELWDKNRQIREQAERLAAQELTELRRESAERYRQLADAMPQIVWTADADDRPTYFNQRWFEYTGLSGSGMDEAVWARVVHPDDLPTAVAERARTVADGSVFEVEYRFRAADGTYRWQLGRAVPIRRDDGSIDFWIGTATDIEERKRTEQRQGFLLDAGAELWGSPDYRDHLRTIAALAVRSIADWCTIETCDEGSRVEPVAAEHADPAKALVLAELLERYSPRPGDALGTGRVLATGESQLVGELSEEQIAGAATDDTHLALLRELGPRSFVCAPIAGRGGPIGAITLAVAGPGRRLGERDLLMAEELARRAGAAIDNAQLYEEVERRARASRVLETIADGVALLDRDDRVLLWNKAAEAITGIPASAVVGRPAGEALPGYAENVARVDVSAGARPETVPLEIAGRELWLSFSGVRFDDGTVYAFRDLTEDRALEQMRADFVATVSHELRTPLSAIYGAAVTLRREDLDLGEPMRLRLLQMISEESDRLAQIVNDVLLASHLDSGRLQLRIAAVDARKITGSVVEAAQAHAPEGISISLETPKKLPRVAADEQQLRQVLVNLVENAVKYSPDGGPVRVRITREPRHVRWAVSDRGLGIPAAERRRVFEKFYRLDPNMTRGVGGTGLGLYICRELVQRLDGRIWVEPRRAGGGSTFYVELPTATRRATAAKTAQAAA